MPGCNLGQPSAQGLWARHVGLAHPARMLAGSCGSPSVRVAWGSAARLPSRPGLSTATTPLGSQAAPHPRSSARPSSAHAAEAHAGAATAAECAPRSVHARCSRFSAHEGGRQPLVLSASARQATGCLRSMQGTAWPPAHACLRATPAAASQSLRQQRAHQLQQSPYAVR